MAKTNPIGVRFDEDKLREIKEYEKLETPQQVLNFLMNKWNKQMDDQFIKESEAISESLKINGLTKTKGIKPVIPIDAPKKELPKTINGKPERLKGEGSIDYQIRVSEWEENNKATN